MSNTQYIRLVETSLEANSVADGDYIIESNIDALGPRNNIIDYFYFVDGAGDPIAATGGTVVITLSPANDVYQTIPEGSFNAVDALTESRTKPNGFGKVSKVKVTLLGITGPPVGFKGLLSQSAN